MAAQLGQRSSMTPPRRSGAMLEGQLEQRSSIPDSWRAVGCARVAGGASTRSVPQTSQLISVLMNSAGRSRHRYVVQDLEGHCFMPANATALDEIAERLPLRCVVGEHELDARRFPLAQPGERLALLVRIGRECGECVEV